MQLKRITDRGLGAKPPATERSLGTIAVLIPFESHFARFQNHLKKQFF